MIDNTDRKPHITRSAFTGNRFEFRAVGSSSANRASAMIALTQRVAEQFADAKRKLPISRALRQA